VQLVVLPDHAGVLRPVRLQERFHVPGFLLVFPRGQLGAAQAFGRVDQVTGWGGAGSEEHVATV